MARPRAVLFDIGGVLVELGGVDEFGAMIGESDHEQIWARWLRCPWVRRYERGGCETAAFAAGMVEHYELDLTAQEFLARFASWPKGLYDGASELVASVADDIHVACLSNTNEHHWSHQRDAFGLGAMFSSYFLSFEVGHVKPDREIFDHALDTLGLAPDEVLFIDDNRINVEGARAAGLTAHVAKGPTETAAILERYELIR